MTSKTCYLQLYIEYILAVQKKYAPAGRKLPLCIMTSGDTNARTIQLLRKNNYFGMSPNQVTIVQQGQGVPAVLDNDARIALESKDKWYKIQTKPHGHGDIHELLHSHGVAKQWKEDGIKWLTLFQDTNGLAFHTLPLMLGVSSKLNLVMNSLTVPRKAKQAVGGIVKLKKKQTGEFRYVDTHTHTHSSSLTPRKKLTLRVQGRQNTTSLPIQSHEG
jgi:UDP-sugar pyrophosphorylase